jgi:hypothetical protein
MIHEPSGRSPSSWLVPVGSFALALLLSSLTGVPGRSLIARQAAECTGVVIPDWEKEIGETKYGKLTAKRTGAKITLTYSALQGPPVESTKDAEKHCKVGAKEVCIEVFSRDSAAPILTIAPTPTGPGGRVLAAGASVTAHFKSFVLTPCGAGVVDQYKMQTVTYGGNPQPNASDKDFVTDLLDGKPLPNTQVPGGGAEQGAFYAHDAPGVVVLKGGTDRQELPYVVSLDFRTFFSCDGVKVAAVIWKTTITVKISAAGVVTGSTTSTPPVIHCAGSAEFTAAEKDVENAKKEKKDKNPKPNK